MNAETTELRHIGSAPFDEDLDWLFNVSPGALGESGMAINPDGGGRSRVIVDTWPYHARMMAARTAVGRDRRLRAVLCELSTRERRIIEARYVQRAYLPLGFETCFRELAHVAVIVAEVEGLLDSMKRWATQRHKYRVEIKAFNLIVRRQVKKAHESWMKAKNLAALEWECPGRPSE